MPTVDESCRMCGDQSIKDEFTIAHCHRLKRWFDASGNFIGPGATPRTRERLWNCFSLLADNTASSHELAHAIILATPVDADHFTPTMAANLLLKFKGKLAPNVSAHLTRILRESVVNRIEVCFGSDAVSNFGAMGAFFLLAAGQILDSYQFDHPHASSPDVYTGDRLTSMGLVKLKAMLWNLENDSLHSEFNSPTYTPITIQCMAKIVELIDNPNARLLARRIEGLLWRESLAFFHKDLMYSCGPYSRAYRIDILNMGSSMRKLFRYVGISKDESIVQQLDEHRAGILFHHKNDLPFVWSGSAWMLSEKFHIPEALFNDLESREYPYHFTGACAWKAFGCIDRKARRFVNVQGGLLAAGSSTLTQMQQMNYAIGSRSCTRVPGIGFPINFHYALKIPVCRMEDVRTVTAGVMFQQRPVELVEGADGQRCEADDFTFCGAVTCELKDERNIVFEARPLKEMAGIMCDEISLNMFVPLHFGPVDEATLNGLEFEAAPLVHHGHSAVCVIQDHGFTYRISCTTNFMAAYRLYRWAHFLRFAAFAYEDTPKLFTAEELDSYSFQGTLTILRVEK